MLHRSFKPAKCKTTLKLASSRIKLMKNKKGVQLNQMKRELAQLIEAGKIRTAMIRVEHVVREEKTIAAYDLLEIYCELIVARMPIIESQKNCPIDLKEAITSVIFASPRCSDISELMDVRKHFTTKYGKEFISAAVELRPDCGVSRMLVEKLSAKAPDGQTKIKILSAIAEEHNIKWDPDSFGENELKPSEDLLNGPNTFEKASKMHTEPPIVQAPPSNVQAPPSRDQKHSAPVNFEHNASSSTSSQHFASMDIGGSQAKMPAISHSDVRPSGTGSERMEVRNSYSGNGNAFLSGGQNWNMEFKDATAAAQAAAESAELASMAARAAAELSSRGNITRQYSTESQKSNIRRSRDEGPRKNAAAKFPTEQFAKDSGHDFFQDRDPQIQTEQVDETEHDSPDETAESFYRDGRGSTRSSRLASLKSNTADEDKLMNDFQKADRNSQKSSFEEEEADNSTYFSGMSIKKESSGSQVEFESGQGSLQSDNFNYFGEERIRKQASTVSHVSNHGDDYDVSPSSHQKYGIKQSRGSSGSQLEFESGQQGNLQSDNFNNFGEERNRKQASTVSSHSHASNHDDDYDVSPSRHQKVKQSGGSQVEFESGQQGGLQSNSFDYFGEERIRKQASSVSSHSLSSNRGDDYDVSCSRHQKYGTNAGKEPFVVGIDQGNIHRDTLRTSSYNNTAVAFDESDSDDDDFRSDTRPKFDGQESKLYSTSPGREPPAHLFSVNTDTRQNISGSHEKSSSVLHVSAEWHLPPEFDKSSTRSAHPSQPDELLPVTFDDSEGLSSESEEELNKSRFSGKTDPSILPHKENIFFKTPNDIQSESHRLAGSFLMEKGDSGYNRKQDLRYSFDDRERVEVSAENNQGTEFSAQSRRKFDFDEVPTHQSSSRHTKHQMASNDMSSERFYNPAEEGKRQQSRQSSRLSLVNEVKAIDNSLTPESPDTMNDDELFGQSSLESGKELKFGTLTGGLRNKGYIRPPYARSPSGDASSSSKAAEDRMTATDQSPAFPAVKSSLNSRVSTEVKIKSSSRAPISNYDSDTDDSEEELPQQNSRSKPEPYNPKASKEVNTKSKFSPPVTFFDYDDDDSEDPPKQTSTSTGRAGSGFSRRTKPTPSSRTSSYSKAKVGSEASVNSDTYSEKITSRSSYGSETPSKPRSQTVNSGRWRSSPEPRAAKQATPKPTQKSNVSMREENLKSSAMEQPSSPLKTVTSASTESPKTSTLSREAPSRESSLNKASHIHPKLPDYDTIAAQLEALRSNRR